MLQTLLSSAVTGLKADVAAQARRVGLMIGLGLVALLFVFVSLGALATAAALALAPYLGLAGAAAVVGAAALVLAAILVFIATYRRPPQTSRTLDEASQAVKHASTAAEKSLAEFSDIASRSSLPLILSALALGVMAGSSKPKRRRK